MKKSGHDDGGPTDTSHLTQPHTFFSCNDMPMLLARILPSLLRSPHCPTSGGKVPKEKSVAAILSTDLRMEIGSSICKWCGVNILLSLSMVAPQFNG